MTVPRSLALSHLISDNFYKIGMGLSDHHDALIYTMVMISAVDQDMDDEELYAKRPRPLHSSLDCNLRDCSLRNCGLRIFP